MYESSFGRGSRGFVVKRLQINLVGLNPDGKYGKKTEDAVKDFQRVHGLPVTGCADALVFRRLGIEFPDLFDLCLNLTGEFEGTGFGGINRTDIDGAGVTLGIAGFTTKHGEVQKLFRNFVGKKPEGLAVFGEYKSVALRRLVVNLKSRQDEWDAFFYQQGRVSDATVKAIATLGIDPVWQNCQREIIRESMWKPTIVNAANLHMVSSRGYALLFDIQVQNGGWRQDHQNTFGKILNGNTELARMKAIAQAVADHATPKWRQDVLKRKLTIAEGRGTVHGVRYDLTNYGF